MTKWKVKVFRHGLMAPAMKAVIKIIKCTVMELTNGVMVINTLANFNLINLKEKVF